ncbi:hypothetical protein PR048_026559 [Dryococelus australis]|uniref:FZ domain-containing protein n=1 Tax=Dryococelus australis TaxID=614101 RepID=A0ABQ9GLN7_9NEOP|nr:hypothetical protein PR048_026559 [Dryococelus australis]
MLTGLHCIPLEIVNQCVKSKSLTEECAEIVGHCHRYSCAPLIGCAPVIGLFLKEYYSHRPSLSQCDSVYEEYSISGATGRRADRLEFGGMYIVKSNVYEDSEVTSEDERPAGVQSADCERRYSEEEEGLGEEWAGIGHGLFWDPFQHSPGVIPENHGKSKSGWPDQETNPRDKAHYSLTASEQWKKNLTTTIQLHIFLTPGMEKISDSIPLLIHPIWKSRHSLTTILPLAPGAAVADRLESSPPTKVNKVQSTTGSPAFRMWESCPDDAVDRRVFSGISRFPHPFIPALLHTHHHHPHWLSRPRCSEPPNLFTYHLLQNLARLQKNGAIPSAIVLINPPRRRGELVGTANFANCGREREMRWSEQQWAKVSVSDCPQSSVGYMRRSVVSVFRIGVTHGDGARVSTIVCAVHTLDVCGEWSAMFGSNGECAPVSTVDLQRLSGMGESPSTLQDDFLTYHVVQIETCTVHMLR